MIVYFAVQGGSDLSVTFEIKAPGKFVHLLMVVVVVVVVVVFYKNIL